MGGCTFWTIHKGKDAKTAFIEAVKAARYEHGHGGYSGTIAEKGSFVPIPFQSLQEPAMRRKAAIKYADELIEAGDRRINDKWGPAGCIELGGGEFLFFGWASS